MKILIVGASGLVGTNLFHICKERGHEVLGTYLTTPEENLRKLDKTDVGAVHTVVDEFEPDAIIDTAAFQAVDECETKRRFAWNVNTEGTANTALAAERSGAKFVFLSTDYVFPGDPEMAPYAEGDSVRPLNFYGKTKYAAEQAANLVEGSTILRPSVIYGDHRSNFVTWALSELRAGNEISIVDDQISRPTFAPDIAEAAIDSVERDLEGLYHATGPVSYSRYEFTNLLAEKYDLDEGLISPISTEEFGQEAKRPTDSSLDSSHLYGDLGWSFRPPADAFSQMYKTS